MWFGKPITIFQQERKLVKWKYQVRANEQEISRSYQLNNYHPKPQHNIGMDPALLILALTWLVETIQMV